MSRLNLSYTDSTCLTRMHHITGDARGDSIEVVGNPDNASYEWVVRRGDEIKHSDMGYGHSSVALRDGLIEYYGARERDPITRTTKATA